MPIRSAPARAALLLLIAGAAHAGTVLQPLGFACSNSSVDGISADGRVVVGHNGFQAIRWENGLTEDLPAGFPAQAFGVSDDGRVIVGRSGSRPLLWMTCEEAQSLSSR